MHDSLIRGLASDGKVKSAATRGPGGAAEVRVPGAVSGGFQYLTVPIHLVPEAAGRARDAIDKAFEQALKGRPQRSAG